MSREPPSSLSAVSRPVKQAPVSMPMRFDRVTGSFPGVCPCTTILPNGLGMVEERVSDPNQIGFGLRARAARPGFTPACTNR